MAASAGMNKGDEITVQWRDAHGTFDAQSFRIVDVINTTVQEIDNGQIWISLQRMQELAVMPGQATLVVLKQNASLQGTISGWTFRNTDYLLQDLHAMVRSKTINASILYAALLFLALLAVFDTQVLSIFRRRKEMGTLMALGMTRGTIIRLFTIEGAFHGVLAALIATVWGAPLLFIVAHSGIGLPQAVGSVGYALGEKLFPVYSAGLVFGTTLLILLTTTIVSFLPTRKIADLKPTDALRGKMS